ncbi:TonB-dependent receptor [Desertivirga brevis]|uniref:TonB-dependent receptor n=1 Tax=Desertivirga brevis TaxID=2810310 RepID=UPI001A96A5BF|nr:carboxypeptidase regulatory-like domain-containing protein [Pedobacter sp. SYSU D00873]
MKCLIYIALLASLMLAGGGALYAQTTKSSIEGRINNADGIPVESASIRMIYLPTGTQYGAGTDEQGRFYLPELKPGGPYQIEVAHIGFDKFQLKDIYLRLGETKSLDIKMNKRTAVLSEVVISATAYKNNNLPIQTGPRLHLNSASLNSMPGVRRSISEQLRRVPQAFGNAIAGGNYRQNFITVDGSEFNNIFGVGENLPGNGAQPISMDAIDQLSVSIAPYNSIWESGFIGGAINIITRSGDNQTRGSAYSYFRNEDMYGYRVGDGQAAKRPLSYQMNGLRVGGPLIKDKLFYFLSFETERETNSPQPFQPSTAGNPYGSGPNTARPSAEALSAIRDTLTSRYGYYAGEPNSYNFRNNSSRFLVRLDWNIATNHTLSLRYNQLNSVRPELVNGSRSPLSAFPVGAGRRNINAVPFSNSNFSTQSNFYSLAGEWNFSVNKRMFNTVRLAFTQQDEPRESNSSIFPFVDILKGGTPFTSFGMEPFTYGNSRQVNLLSVADFLHGSSGKHQWQIGVQADYSRTKNTYMPFGTGYFTFASWDDFLTGQKPVDYAVTYSVVPGVEKPSYSFVYTNTALFGQDHFALNKRIGVTAALRTDLPVFPDPLAENTLAGSLKFSGGQDLITSRLPRPAFLFSPRLSFHWDIDQSKNMRLRGGSGIFTGRIPFVWIISQARYSGMYQATQTWQGQENTPGPFGANPKAYIPAETPEAGSFLPAVMSVLSPDFKMPQTWKTSLGIDALLPAGIKGTLDVLYNKDIHAIVFKDINLVTPQPLNIPDYPDHRLVYPAAINQRFIHPLNASGVPDANGNSAFNAVLVGNSSRGYYWSVTMSVERQLNRSLNFSASYVKSFAKSLNDGDGDQTLSALTATPTVNGINHPQLSYSGFVSPSQLRGIFSYRTPVSKHLQLSAYLFYQGSIDGRFSYTYARDLVNDGTNKSLIYVPRDKSEIRFAPIVDNNTGKVMFTAEQQQRAFFDYVEQDNYLRTRKGRYAERNGAQLPWRNQVDLKLTADITLTRRHNQHSLQFTADLLNAGNLFNPAWGNKKLVNASAILVPVNLNAVKPGGDVQPVFQMATPGGKLLSDTFRNDVSLNSTYIIQLGLRYTLN